MKEELSSLKFPKFLVDGMLGSLARKLRILGFDTDYDVVSQDAQLLKKASSSARFLITSDVELFVSARRMKIRSTLIGAGSDKEQLFEVLSKSGQVRLDTSKIPRCSECNGILETSDKYISGNRVYVCQDCSKEYWKGRHWKKLGPLFQEVDSMLMKSQRQERVRSVN